MARAHELDVWLEPIDRPIGRLSSSDRGNVEFRYDPEYVAGDGMPLSLSLGLQDEPFGDVRTRAYFDNLLPENTQLSQLIAREGLARDDIVGILGFLGADCSGAVSCLPIGSPPIKRPGDLDTDYVTLEPAALAAIVVSLAEQGRLPPEADDPSPLAGVQNKVALNVIGDRYALPRSRSGAPTTHILKVARSGSGREAKFEAAAARLAKIVGLEVSVPTILDVAGHQALLIERFDRRIDNGKVHRIHQEDFAQALGLPPELKYERNGTDDRRFDLKAVNGILRQTATPGLAREKFLAATLFNLMIGNNDNHAKNHALLYRRPGRAPEFAPLYDLEPVLLNHQYTDSLAFQIGKATRAIDLTAEDIRGLFQALGFTKAAQERLVDRTVRPMALRIDGALDSLGAKPFADLVGRELAHIVEVLGLQIEVATRDYLPRRNEGGWRARS